MGRRKRKGTQASAKQPVDFFRQMFRTNFLEESPEKEWEEERLLETNVGGYRRGECPMIAIISLHWTLIVGRPILGWTHCAHCALPCAHFAHCTHFAFLTDCNAELCLSMDNHILEANLTACNVLKPGYSFANLVSHPVRGKEQILKDFFSQKCSSSLKDVLCTATWI